jgi:hypothetical protein
VQQLQESMVAKATVPIAPKFPRIVHWHHTNRRITLPQFYNK